MLNIWNHHELVSAKTRRERPPPKKPTGEIHLHEWRLMAATLEDEPFYVCRCQKRITTSQIREAPLPAGVFELFRPMSLEAEQQLLSSFSRPLLDPWTRTPPQNPGPPRTDQKPPHRFRL